MRLCETAIVTVPFSWEERCLDTFYIRKLRSSAQHTTDDDSSMFVSNRVERNFQTSVVAVVRCTRSMHQKIVFGCCPVKWLNFTVRPLDFFFLAHGVHLLREL